MNFPRSGVQVHAFAYMRYDDFHEKHAECFSNAINAARQLSRCDQNETNLLLLMAKAVIY